MKSCKGFLLLLLAGLFFVTKTCFALPFSITPLGTLPTTVQAGYQTTAYYTVTNNTTVNSTANFVKFTPPNVRQVINTYNNSICRTQFNLAPGGSCTLQLVIDGAVDANDSNPQHHLYICRKDGKTCASPQNQLNVKTITLNSITVTPPNPILPAGTTQNFSAIGWFSDGTSSILSDVIWSSSDGSKIAVDPSTGIATAVGTSGDTATITATQNSTSGSTTASISDAELVSITIAPAITIIDDTSTQQYTAIGSYSDGTLIDITSTSTWISTDPSKATINVSTGLATGVSAGTTTITATKSGKTSNTATLNVTTVSLVSITVTPTNTSIANGTTQQYTATGIHSNGTTSDLTATATWASTDITKASINITGLATGQGLGSTIITATKDAITSNLANLTVTDATLTSIAITPLNPSTTVGGTEQFTATGTYTDSSTQDITTAVTWSSSDPNIATISSFFDGGLATGIDIGSSTIQASMNGINSSTTLNVTANTILRIFAGSGTSATDANVCYSTNNGTSWSPANCGSIATGIQANGLATTTNYVFAGLGSGQVCRSSPTSSPLSWTCLDTKPSPPPILSLVANTSKVYAGLNDGDVCTSNNNASTFTCTTTSTTHPILSLALDNLNVYAGKSNGKVCVYDGALWTCPSNPDLTNPVNALATFGSFIFAGTQSGKACVSNNSASTWPSCTTLTTAIKAMTTDSEGHIFAGLQNGQVCVSHNNTSTFTCVTASTADPILSLTVDANDYIYAGTTAGKVCRSINIGLSWQCSAVNTLTTISALAAQLP